MTASLTLLDSPAWEDYELLDSGHGLKLERFGPYRFVRPEVQAMWTPALPEADWKNVDGIFRPTSEESGGHWELKRKIPERWQMKYRDLRFWAMTTPGRHLGVFPEGAAHWDWMSALIRAAGRPVHVLNLFGYTGLASLTAAAAGASVTHIDASKKSIAWARDNQALSKLNERPIRWVVEDALKYVVREERRGVKYDGLLLDPPKFGRGPKGEVWEVYKSLPELLKACASVLSDRALFAAVTIYAVRASGVHLSHSLREMTGAFAGEVQAGELVTREKSAGRFLSHAVYARWSAG